MEVVKGRDNLAATIYVPYNCENVCEFCSSKAEYGKVDEGQVIMAIDTIKNLNIKEIVITGGEPMQNMMFLRYVVGILGEGRDIYINTTLLDKSYATRRFIDFVNETPSIKGINISRHCTTYEEDCKMVKNIAKDEIIKEIKKSVRINIVTESLSYDKIALYFARWKDFDVHLNFRADYNNTTEKDLNSFNDKNLALLSDMATNFLGYSRCNVCSTINFNCGNTRFSYHRGLKNTSILKNNILEINDLIIFPDGVISYDWNRENKYIKNVLDEFDKDVKIKRINETAKIVNKLRTENLYQRHSCNGSSSCEVSSICSYTENSHRYGYCGSGSSCGGGGRC